MWGSGQLARACLLSACLVVSVSTIDTWEQDFRKEFEERQPHAVNITLNVLRKYKVKAEKLGPVLIHCAGAEVKDKFLVASRQGEEYSRVQQFQNAAASCTHVQIVSLLDPRKQPASLTSLQHQICQLPCSNRVLVLEGLSNSTMLVGESLLAQIADKKVVSCGNDGLSTDGWVVIVISDLGADAMEASTAAGIIPHLVPSYSTCDVALT